MSESQKTVMVVEDDLILSLLYQKFLKTLGFTIKGNVVNAKKALEMAEKINPDLIIMDIALGGEMDGIEAMQEIRKFTLCPVIYITANSSSHYKMRAQKTGFHDFLVKPVDFHDLEKSVTTLFEK
ncbi:MAG: response regulator [Candidatus Cyclobacteriaceae bacterium M2_1C_046]